jgi:hypothetical protein
MSQQPGAPPNPPLPPGAAAGANVRFGGSPVRSPPHSRDQSPNRQAQRDPFMASHEVLPTAGNYPMSSLNAPQGPGSFTTGSNYGTAPSSPYEPSAGQFSGSASPYNQGSYNQIRGPQGFSQNSYGAPPHVVGGMSSSSVQLNDFGAVDHDSSVGHGRYQHDDNEENRPLNEGAGFTGGFYPPMDGGGLVLAKAWYYITANI